jgi:hypothetical protein
MAIDIEHVQPGELITATLLNEVIDELAKLDVRVTALETTGSKPGVVEITAVTPRTVQVGDFITIVGKNFGFTIGATRVRFNGVAPFEFGQGSNDSVLIVKVPELGVTLPNDGIKVELTVSNATSTAQEEITVKPVPLQQAGTVTVTFSGVQPNPPTPDTDTEFEYVMVSDATLAATVTVAPSIIDAAGAPLGWGALILDSTKKVIENKQIKIDPGDTLAFYVRVRIPSQTNGTQFVIQTSVAGGGLSGASDETPLTVGQASNVDTTITKLAPVDAVGIPLNPKVTLVGSKLSTPLNVVAQVTMEVDFTFAGDYLIELTPATGTSNWLLAVIDPAPPTNSTVGKLSLTTDDIINAGGTVHEDIKVRLRPSTGATAGHAVLTVHRDGETTKRSYTFDLAVAT